MIDVLQATIGPVSRKALPVQVSHTFTPQSTVLDEDNLVSCAGLVPVMALAEQAGLSELLASKIDIATPRVKSGSANPAPKLATLIASMCAGADYIDDVDLVRADGMKTLFHRVYAPSTVGTLLREFTFGHARQLDSGKGAARMVAQAITTARAAGVSGLITVRGDSAYGNRAVIRVCRRHGAVFSLVLARNTAVQRAIDAIHQDAWTPVQYPGAVRDPDPDTGAWISDAEVAETTYTMAESGTGSITARLIVRRVKDATTPPTACSRSGAITRFSPTPPSLPPTPISPTAATRSSNPPSPISSTGPWPTSLLGASAPIPRGRSARPSRIICCARPRPWPAPATAAPAAPPCAVTWSTSPPAWPDLNANPSCTYPPTGPGSSPGSPCGTTPSADDPAPNHHSPDPTTRTPTGKARQTSGPLTPATSQNQDQKLHPPTQGLSVESGLSTVLMCQRCQRPIRFVRIE
jgi:hypothetical protein